MVKKTTKISSKKLAEAIQTVVKQVLLQEGTHFTAMRNIEHMATSMSMDFEKSIADALNLMNPDNMQPQLQAKYYGIVTQMKDQIRQAALDAAKGLISFPRQDDGKETK